MLSIYKVKICDVFEGCLKTFYYIILTATRFYTKVLTRLHKQTKDYLQFVWGSNLGPVKLSTELPTARHRCDITSKKAVYPRRNDA